MFSKRLVHGWLTALAVTATIATVVSCTPKIGEDPPDQTQQELGGTECLTATAATIREYFRGDATNDAVEDGWTCLGVAFEKFNKYVRGKDKNYFTPQELADFFEQNFMGHDTQGKPVTKIGPELQTELMKFKQIFLGGSRENVTREEIMRGARLFVDLKRITVHLNPYMKILVQKWTPQNLTILGYRADVDFFRAANLEVQAAAKDLSLLIQAQHDPYKLDDAVSFLREISKFYNEDGGMVDQVVKFMPVVKKIKIALAGGSEEDIRSGEWRRILLLGGRGYMQYLRYKYFIQGPINAGKGLQLSYVADTFEDALSIFEDLVREKPSGVVSREEMNEILVAFSAAWPDFHYSDKLGSEAMKLKQVFIGGEHESWSVRDFENARLKVKALRVIFERVLPYVDIYTGEWNPTKLDAADAQQAFADATDALATSAEELGSNLETSYAISDARAFAKEWSRLYPQPPGEGFSAKIEPYLPVVQNLKNTAFGDTNDVIGKTQWPMFLKVSGQAYMIYLRYDYFLKNIPTGDTAAELAPLAATLDDAVGMLSGITAAKPGGKITLVEMNKLLASLSSIWKGLPYSDKLGVEIMKLKQALVGGANDSWTVADFQQLQGKAKIAVAMVQQLLPHLDVYKGSWDPTKLDPTEAATVFNDAKSALDSAAVSAGKLFAGDYSLRDLKSLVGEWTKVSPPSKPENGLDKMLETYSPLVQKTKNLLFGDNDDVFHPAQWPVLLSIGVEGFSDFRYYDYFVDRRDWNDSATYGVFGRFVDTGLALANKILDTKPSHALSPMEIRSVFETLQKAGFLTSLSIRGDTLEYVVSIALNRVLQSPKDRLDGKTPISLTKASLAYARSQLFVWITTQQFLLDVVNAAPNKEISAVDLLAKIDALKTVNPAPSPLLMEGVVEMTQLINAKVLLTLDAGGRVIVSGRLSPKIGVATAKMENMVRAVDRVLMYAYVDSLDRIKNFTGVRAEEAEVAFQELRGLAIDIGLLSETNTTFVSNRFRESNIFMPHSNGDNLASFSEVGDLVTMILSGLKLDSQMRASLVKECSSVADPKQSDTIAYGCLYGNYKRQFPVVFTSLPEFQKYQSAQDNDTFNFFTYNSLKAAGYVPNLQDKVKFEDIALLPHLIQYVELLLSRFDLNRDNAIDSGEAELAFPAFRSLFKELAKKELESGLIKEEELLALFEFVLYYGRPPGLADLLKWNSWKKNPSKWTVVYADRTKMAQILGYVADQLAKPAAVANPVGKDDYMDRAGFGG